MANPIPALLDQLHAAGNPGTTGHAWTDATQLETVMLLSPDRRLAYLYRVPSPPFPSNAAHNSWYACNLYVQNVEACRTVADCLARFNIEHDRHASWKALTLAGQPVDPAAAPVQAVCLVSAP